MKENYYALLICIFRKDYTVERSIRAMTVGKVTKKQNKSVVKSDVKDMIRMKQQGMTFEAIGQLYGLSKGAVYRRLKRYKEAVAV